MKKVLLLLFAMIASVCYSFANPVIMDFSSVARTNNNDNQQGWNGLNEIMDKITMAKYFVIETKGVGNNKDGFNGIKLAFQGSALGWSDVGLNGDWQSFPRADGKTVSIAIDIQSALGAKYDAFLQCTGWAQFFLQYYPGGGMTAFEGLGFQQAYLAGDFEKPVGSVDLSGGSGFGFIFEGSVVDIGGVAPPPPSKLDLLPTFGNSGSDSNTYDASTHTVTFASAWGAGKGWWFGTSPGKDLSYYNQVVINFEPVDFQVQVVIEYNDGSRNTVIADPGATSLAILLMGGKDNVKQIYIQTSAAGTLKLLEAYADQNAVFATGVSLDKTSVTINVGATEYLKATVEPENATNKNIIWSSSDESVATVAYGTVTAVSKGTATITATTEDGSYTAECTVTVIIPVTGVRLNLTTAKLDIGNYIQLRAIVDPANADNPTVTWKSSNESIATVSDNGLVTGISEGTVTITVTTNDGGYTANCIVTVSPDPVYVTGVSLNQTSAELVVGDNLQLTAFVEPKNADIQTVTWKSSDETVATVSDNGLVKAVGKGTVTITVTTDEGGFTASCEITVSQQEIVMPDNTQTGTDGKGNILLSLSTPTNELFSGSFRLILPDGVQVDLSATRLIGDLASLLNLNIVQEEDGSWLFTITPINESVNGVDYSQIMEIAYIVNETVEKGDYEAAVRDLSFTFGDGTSITKSEIPIQLTVTSTTGIPNLIAVTSAYISNDQLYIQSPLAETVQVYSITGVLLYNFQKTEGKVSYPINQLKGATLIVKGSSGWVKKLIKN